MIRRSAGKYVTKACMGNPKGTANGRNCYRRIEYVVFFFKHRIDDTSQGQAMD